MNRFPTLLPPDIVLQIYSYINQSDYVHCMQTCRHWYSEMPLYATDLWKEITISPTAWSKTNKCLIRCLGQHTKHVYIDEVDMFSVLNRLKDLNCEITSLEIIKGDVEDVTQCIEDNGRFLSTIGQFNNSLRKLSIIDHLSYLPATTVLRNFPNLTHLTLVFNYQLHSDISKLDKSDDIDSSWSHQLVYLHLDACLNFDHGIVSVLRRCPMLRILRLSTIGIDPVFPPDNFDMIMQSCAHLTHLSWNDSRDSCIQDSKLTPDDWSNVSFAKDVDSLRAFHFIGSLNHIDHAITIIKRSQYEMEYLVLGFWGTTMAPRPHTRISHIRLPRLKTLEIGSLKMVSDDWVSFLTGCENLESLDLYLFKEDLLMDTLCEIASTLKHLRYLKLNRRFERWYSRLQEEDMWTNASILSSSQLEILDLHGVFLTDALLLDLCDIPCLKELTLSQVWNDNISLEGLLSFTDKLNTKERCLATLKLLYFPALNDTILERLSHIESLTLLVVKWCFKITESGLELFVANSSNNGRKRRVHVQECKLVRQTRF
ncbi:hypothetical protein BJV82DRAFT_344307 [Fennellomyces sp. T-0311]|nr:hypothetical protein BJV82DRAFT_344307 [Fennellomyces sp. T-0311]